MYTRLFKEFAEVLLHLFNSELLSLDLHLKNRLIGRISESASFKRQRSCSK